MESLESKPKEEVKPQKAKETHKETMLRLWREGKIHGRPKKPADISVPPIQ
jgi:hypothetical protein